MVEPVVEIELTQGYVALVDPIDMDLLDFQWRAYTKPFTTYAARSVYKNGKQTIEQMHRAILSRVLNRVLSRAEEVDHINHNGLDNRRRNLRLTDRLGNCRNVRVNRSNNTLGYKGVSVKRKFWRAQIGVGGKLVQLGTFNTKQDAAIAYNHAALRYFREFAEFNDIPDWRTTFPVPRPLRINPSGLPGIYFHKRDRKWIAQISINGKRKFLGKFDAPEQAHAAYSAFQEHIKNGAVVKDYEAQAPKESK